MSGAYRVTGEVEWQMEYPNGRTWQTIILVELRDGKVWRETRY